MPDSADFPADNGPAEDSAVIEPTRSPLKSPKILFQTGALTDKFGLLGAR